MKRTTLFLLSLTIVCSCQKTDNGSAVKAPDAIDLGLSVKWASYNLGASSPEEYGYFYAWGELEPKNEYTYATYKFREPTEGYTGGYIKYVNKNGIGNIDNIATLELADDVAHVKLGGKWRMPTKEEITELVENCTWTKTTRGGIDGYEVKSNAAANTNSIFLPVGGDKVGLRVQENFLGGIWSSSLYTDFPNHAYNLTYDITDGAYYAFHLSYWHRETGFPVRPVLEK